MDELLQHIRRYVQDGRLPKVREAVTMALNQGISPDRILYEGLIAGMEEVSRCFDSQRVFVPEVLIAARALNKGMEMLAPYLKSDRAVPIGTAVVGTVRGDLHDVGKNLVRIMMESKGIRVIDLGVDVSADDFLSAVKQYQADIVLCSTLLTTTMVEMKQVVEKLRSSGMTHKFRIMVGGAPVTQQFCKQIGADAYTENAVEAANRAVSFLRGELKEI